MSERHMSLAGLNRNVGMINNREKKENYTVGRHYKLKILEDKMTSFF